MTRKNRKYEWHFHDRKEAAVRCKGPFIQTNSRKGASDLPSTGTGDLVGVTRVCEYEPQKITQPAFLLCSCK